jgi:DNA-binding NtrC family response regulator
VEPRAFKILLERAIRHKRSLQKTDEPKRDLSLRGVLGGLVGTSPAMHQIFSLIRQVAPTSAPVLISGESLRTLQNRIAVLRHEAKATTAGS